MSKVKDLAGYDNGYVKVLEFIELRRRSNTTFNSRFWKCLCRCGKEIILYTNQIMLGIPRGCCYKQKYPGNKINHIHQTSHGFATKGAQHPLYRKWRAMISRCYNPKTKDYRWYGGKGIKLHPDWKNSFQAFYDWCMANNWVAGLTIDRIDPDKYYSPDNCRLVTHSENLRAAASHRRTKL